MRVDLHFIGTQEPDLTGAFLMQCGATGRAPDPDWVFIRGDGGGTIDLACGFCARVVLAEMHSADQVEGAVIRCPGCLGYNRTRT